MSSRASDPLTALHRLGLWWRPRLPERTLLDRALGRHLAGALEVSAAETAGEPRATLNGYALPAGAGAGEYPFDDTAGTLPEAVGGLPVLRRVESGERLPRGVDRVVPVEATVIVAASGAGPPRLRIASGALPPPGHGVGRGRGALAVEAGTRVDARLLALFHAAGMATVETFPPERVGILSIGSDLTDVTETRPADGAQRDLTGFWLPFAVKSLGHHPVPLGIAGDGLEEGREALLRARKRKLRFLIAAGGIGDGLRDRTIELLTRIGARIHLDGVALRPGRRLVAAEWEDLKILALGGQPLDAAVGFDLFARPALLRALGAPATQWDWSRWKHPAALLDHLPPANGAPGGGLWTAVAVAEKARGAGWAAVVPLDPFLPGGSAQTGWAVIPPPAAEATGRGEGFYFQSRTADAAGPAEPGGE